MDTDLKCDVCGQPAIEVVASSLGPISFAKCEKCLKEGLEPYWIVVGTFAMIGGIDYATDWLREIVDRTIEFNSVTMEKFLEDVQSMFDILEDN